MKAVRILSGSGDQGKAFGFFEGGRGVAAALMAMAAVVAFRIGAGQMEDQVQGMKYVIVFYSVLTILMGVLSFLTVKDDKIEESEKISKEEKMKIIYKKLNEKLKKYLRS